MRVVAGALIGLGLIMFTAAKPAAAQDAQDRLWSGAVSGDTAMISKAVTDGAKVDSLDTRVSANGRRALNYAAINNHVNAIKLLLSLKASIDLPNVSGFTPLHHAAESGSLEAANALIAAGANTTLTNRGGFKAADIARAKGFENVALIIEAAPKKAQ